MWLKYVSWFGYANELLVVNQWYNIKDIACSTSPILCFLEGKSIIDYLNIKEVTYVQFLNYKSWFLLIFKFLIAGKFLLQYWYANLFNDWIQNTVFCCLIS